MHTFAIDARTGWFAQNSVSKPQQPSGVGRAHKQIQKQVYAAACDVRSHQRRYFDFVADSQYVKRLVGRVREHVLRPHAESEVFQTRDSARVIVVFLHVVCIDRV